ncbi:MAG: hypothetical protein KKG92_13525 [Gammaproteobacteria bacterium]|nr:hypothetical protein [Gammaproteobacteria bacterium]
MAAPIVLASLVSKPVLGAASHNCTISGQVSGNVSTHLQGDCRSLGETPAYYAGLPPASWPNATNDFLNNLNRPRQFPVSPYTLAWNKRFKDAYEVVKTAGGPNPPLGTSNIATVWDVLSGYMVNVADGTQNPNWTLKARSGFVSDPALGQEAIAAYMNAVRITGGYPDYPLTPSDVVAMFNAVVVTGGGYQVSPSVVWNAADVLSYFRSLHA